MLVFTCFTQTHTDSPCQPYLKARSTRNANVDACILLNIVNTPHGLLFSVDFFSQSLLFPPPGTKPASSASLPHVDRDLIAGGFSGGNGGGGGGGGGGGRWGGSDDASSTAGDFFTGNGDGYTGGGGGGFSDASAFSSSWSAWSPSAAATGGGGGSSSMAGGLGRNTGSSGGGAGKGAGAGAATAQARLAEQPGAFWDLYGSAEEGEGAITGNVVLALDALGSFDFYSLTADCGARGVGGIEVSGEVRLGGGVPNCCLPWLVI